MRPCPAEPIAVDIDFAAPFLDVTGFPALTMPGRWKDSWKRPTGLMVAGVLMLMKPGFIAIAAAAAAAAVVVVVVLVVVVVVVIVVAVVAVATPTAALAVLSSVGGGRPEA